MVERELPKLVMRVRFPLPAPINKMHPCGAFFCLLRVEIRESNPKGLEEQKQPQNVVFGRQAKFSSACEKRQRNETSLENKPRAKYFAYSRCLLQ